jgi:hypothetical protein
MDIGAGAARPGDDGAIDVRAIVIGIVAWPGRLGAKLADR